MFNVQPVKFLNLENFRLYGILSLVERLSSFQRFSMYRNYGESGIFGTTIGVPNIQCPFLRGSFIRDLTV